MEGLLQLQCAPDRFYSQPPTRTIMMNTDTHTSAQAFGKVMSMLEPDRTRKPEIVWQELIDQRLDMTEVNARWLDEYKA